MKLWNKKNATKNEKAAEAKLASKELSDDLMAQITGGVGKAKCHASEL